MSRGIMYWLQAAPSSVANDNEEEAAAPDPADPAPVPPAAVADPNAALQE